MKADKLLRVDKEVYDSLTRKAEGFQTPNAVLRKMLHLPPTNNRRGRPKKEKSK